MSAERGELGLKGEEAAARLLESKGFRVLGRRVRTLGGELDLVAQDRDTLVFVEVKAAGGRLAGSHPAENVHRAKRRRLIRAARAYLAGLDVPCACRSSPGGGAGIESQCACRSSPGGGVNIKSQWACRFDVVTVQGGEKPCIEHFAGAFGA